MSVADSKNWTVFDQKHTVQKWEPTDGKTSNFQKSASIRRVDTLHQRNSKLSGVRNRKLLRPQEKRAETCSVLWVYYTRDGKKLTDWFGKVERSGISELARFAKRLREDEAAVQAAMKYE